MGHWNYRLVKVDDRLIVAEVYYDDEGNPTAFMEDAVSLEGFDYSDNVGPDMEECKADIHDTLAKIQNDLKRYPDILDAETDFGV